MTGPQRDPDHRYVVGGFFAVNLMFLDVLMGFVWHDQQFGIAQNQLIVFAQVMPLATWSHLVTAQKSPKQTKLSSQCSRLPSLLQRMVIQSSADDMPLQEDMKSTLCTLSALSTLRSCY